MVYVTGDTHGDFSRFKKHIAKKLKKNDVLIILGDFGFIWDDSQKEKQRLKKLEKLKYTVAFIDGSHENYTLLARYPTGEWGGGKVGIIGDNLYHLRRGEIYTIEGETFFTFGGGQSPDKDIRTEKGHKNINWWEQEMPTEQEMIYGRKNLENHGNAVNYILTHEPTERHGGMISDRRNSSGMNIFLNSIEQTAKYDMWFFGSIHRDKQISAKHRALFTDIVPVKGK